MYRYVKDTKCTKILSNSSRFFYYRYDGSYYGSSVHLVERLVFLPCVEVIPEHTDRAARIKQSRVKMMRLKAKRGRGGMQGTGGTGQERKKSIKGFPEAGRGEGGGGDKNIEESEENFPLLRRISIRRVSGLLEFAGPFQWT